MDGSTGVPFTDVFAADKDANYHQGSARKQMAADKSVPPSAATPQLLQAAPMVRDVPTTRASASFSGHLAGCFLFIQGDLLDHSTF